MMAPRNPPENWRPPSHTAMRSTGASISSQCETTQVSRAPMTPATTRIVAIR